MCCNVYRRGTFSPLLQTGLAGGRGDHSRLCQSTHKEVSANGLVSDFRNVAVRTLTILFIKAVMKELFLVTLIPMHVVIEKKYLGDLIAKYGTNF